MLLLFSSSVDVGVDADTNAFDEKLSTDLQLEIIERIVPELFENT